MPLQRHAFTVWVNGTEDEPTEHSVTITHQDQLRAEAELARAGIDPQTRALALSTAFCWAALARTGALTSTFKRFYDIECAGVQADAGDPDPVDPTQEAADTASPSLSPESGPESTG